MTATDVPLGPTQLLIGGQWRPGGDGGTRPVVNPASGEAFAEIATANVDDAIAAVEAAAAAAEDWAATPPRERSEILRGAFEAMIAQRERLAAVITAENGKTLAESRAEVDYAAEFFRWFAEEAVRIGGEIRTAPKGDKRIVVLPQPVGVSVLVTPWNFPAAMATRKLGPALAAGCTMVLKPASATPLTALLVAELLAEAGVPDGVVNVVVPDPPGAAVEAMLRHPAVRKLSFTGSTEVGAQLLALAAPNVLRCSMELGGNAPFLVCEDADLDVAVEAALVAKLRNTGASCVAANRFYAHEAVAGAFAARLAEAMAAKVVGPGDRDGVDLGALVSTDERDKVAELVDQAVGDGGTLRTGGSSPDGPGAFYLPTVLDVDAENDLLDHEIFGPVAPVVTVADDDEAVALANGTPFGLIAYVMSGDLGRAMSIAERVDAGMVAINRGIVSDPAAPFGGTKLSGLGKEGGVEGIEEYLERKYIGVDW